MATKKTLPASPTTVSAAKVSLATPSDILATQLRARIVGQTEALDTILPYVEMFQAGINPAGRPVGVFLLLGNTGSGKTRTVEALAEVLHGTSRAVLRVDCGEYQMEHEVAKLVGAPPGYLGHRETQSVISGPKLTAVTTERCGMSLVLFDEIEKAAPSLVRLLLGVLDRGILRLGDGTTVDFSRSLIFMTSNLGAKELSRGLRPFGLAPHAPLSVEGRAASTQEVCRKRFPVEFMNRIDASVVYAQLNAEDMKEILDIQLGTLQAGLNSQLGHRSFTLQFTGEAKEFLLRLGTSPEFGARELKRVMHRCVTQRLARLLTDKVIQAGDQVTVGVESDTALSFSVAKLAGAEAA